MIPVAGIAASKGKETAQALTGDIYVRKWTTVKGKGKKAFPVDHELRVNALTLAIAAVGAGVTALTGAAALWFAQTKITPKEGKELTLRCRVRRLMENSDGTQKVSLTYYRNSVPVAVTYANIDWSPSGILGLMSDISAKFLTLLPSKYDWTAGTVRTVQTDSWTDFIAPYTTTQGTSLDVSERTGFSIKIG